ncbi:MAG TPA: site-specific integrase [Acidimicrobiia bacterium]|nr:site-specific integrase [Acidimicrobiia bacterium]
MRGSVIRRGSKWAVVIDIGRDPSTGRRVRRWHSGFNTRKEAERAARDLLSRVESGTYVDSAHGRRSVGEFLVDEWLPAKRATVKATTLASYRLHVNAYIVPRLGALRLSMLRAPQLNAFYADLLEDGRCNGDRGLSPKTVRNIHGTLHKALDDAVRWGRIARNPAALADPPKGASPEMRIWTAEQLRAFLDHVRTDRLVAAWQLLATTGMRRGELLGLRWLDVDLDDGFLAVRQTRVSVDYEVAVGTPKTERGNRTVALDPATVAVLREHRARQLEERLAWGPAWTDTGLVFTREDGTEIHPQRLSQYFRRHTASSGLPPIRLHDVRHSYATALIKAGQPIKVVSQRIGHASPTITMAIYQHVLPSDDVEAAATGARLILGT